MNCKVEGCGRSAMYQSQKVCQMHYFRMMRNGTYDIVRSRKYRISNPAGYQKVHEPRHHLADGQGYVYEHRLVYCDNVNSNPLQCELCSRPISWKTCHIDHIDEDVTNNKKENLRALCRGCNVFRGHTCRSMGKTFLTIGGKTMTPSAWSRQKGVKVSGSTIRRRKILGWSDCDAVYGEKTTHKNCESQSRPNRYDEVRGIA